MSVVATKPSRFDLKPGEVLCDHCTAKCCRYFALPIDTPKNRRDFDFIRWYLLHESASVFTEDDSWYILVHTKCRHLQDNNLCGIYETRPQICRDYTTDRRVRVSSIEGIASSPNRRPGGGMVGGNRTIMRLYVAIFPGDGQPRQGVTTSSACRAMRGTGRLLFICEVVC